MANFGQCEAPVRLSMMEEVMNRLMSEEVSLRSAVEDLESGLRPITSPEPAVCGNKEINVPCEPRPSLIAELAGLADRLQSLHNQLRSLRQRVEL